MIVSPGARLAEFEIVEPIGAGGMGEVYRARDTKLGRDVAVKVLPDAFVDAERRHRFEREARLLASLNHPHVATLHGFFEHDGTPFLVMELVPGETLEQRLVSGPLAIDECLALFRQVAEGLAAAHEQGIIHRDLKPANIKITPDRRVKVLDFGLAKALGDDGPAPDLSESPTASADATRAGVILGTAAYMSPEQARGQRLDRRTDVWSFAAVLYEALTDRKAFSGETLTDVLAAIVGLEPDWSALPKETPRRLRDLLRRCLRKDPAWRLDSMNAARLDLEEALEDGPERTPTTASRRWLVGHLATATAAALLAWVMLPRPAPPPRPITRFVIELPPGHSVSSLLGSVALSSDGRHVVYVDRTDDHRLYWRALDRLESTPLEGAEDASFPFFSPDSRWVGFFGLAGGLRRVSLEGGPPVTVARDARGFTRASISGGTIYYATVGRDAGIWRVSSDGGVPERVSIANEGDFLGNPRFLPEADVVLFGAAGDVVALELESGTRSTVLENARYPVYSSGYLVFTRPRDPMLYAVAFDPARVATVGAPVALGETPDPSPNGVRHFDLASNGDLVMVSAGAAPFQIVWVDRAGAAQPVTSEPEAFQRLRLSPSEGTLVVSVAHADRERELSLYDLERGSWSRFTFDPGTDTAPLWSPDGASIFFVSNRSGRLNMYRKPSDGTGEPTQVIDLPDAAVVHAITPDGRQALFHTEAGRDIRALDLQDGTLSSVVATESAEFQPVLSPDGCWLAYVSDASGRNEIYVQPYPSLDGIWQVSSAGGVEPLWSRSGGELFYRDGSRMMSVAVDTSDGFKYEAPTLLFDAPYELDPSNDTSNYDVAADGRFLMIRRDPSVRTQLTVVQGFRRILEETVPTGKSFSGR